MMSKPFGNSYKIHKNVANPIRLFIQKPLKMMPKPCAIHIKMIKMSQTLLDNSYKNFKNVANPTR